MSETSATLIEQLRARFGTTSDEDLAFHLRDHGVRVTAKSVGRWRRPESRGGPEWDTAIALLELAGWLNARMAPPRAEARDGADNTDEGADGRIINVVEDVGDPIAAEPKL